MITIILKYWKLAFFAISMASMYYIGETNSNSRWKATLESERVAFEKRIAAVQTDFNSKQKSIASDFDAYVQTRTTVITKLKQDLKNVKQQNDSTCVILNGSVNFHDWMSAASTVGSTDTGSSTGSVSDFDGTPSDVTLSEMLNVVGENYNTCYIEMNKLKALQDVVREFQQAQGVKK